MQRSLSLCEMILENVVLRRRRLKDNTYGTEDPHSRIEDKVVPNAGPEPGNKQQALGT